MPLLLSEADIRSVLDMDDLIEAMQAALVEYSTGSAAQPVRSVLQVGARRNFLGVMPAHLRESGALATKLVTFFESNAGSPLPTHLATIVLLDDMTGGLLAVMDGRFITESRTAAVSALSTRLLARDDAEVLAILGSGVQAVSHLEAIPHVRPVREARVWSPGEARRAGFAERHSTSGLPVVASPSAREAVRDADIIVLVTAASTPIVERPWIRPGAHICAVGACRPDQREMETALVQEGRVFVDSRPGALAEAGDLLIPLGEGAITERQIAGELGELAAGRIAGRGGEDQITIFKSLGMAVEDAGAARLAYTRAVGRGLGQRFWDSA